MCYPVAKYYCQSGASYRVPVPNIDRKIFVCLVWSRSQLFQARTKIFLCLHNLWILLFPIIYNPSIHPRILAEKSAVYDEGLPLLILGDMSPISTLHINMVPNIDTPAKYMRKRTSWGKKAFFTSFAERKKVRCLRQFCRACSILL